MDELTPEALHGEAVQGVEPDLRNLSIEDVLRRQLDRVAYLRSSGLDFSEAVLMLRDLLVGVEDDEFFDGVPATVRGTEGAREAYAERGWDTMVVTASSSGGRAVLTPSNAELGVMLRCLTALMARRGLTFRSQFSSRVPQEWG